MIKQYFDTLDANNYTILPCNGKIPLVSSWTTATNDENWKEIYPQKNIGILIGKKLLAIDVDITDEECAIAVGQSIIKRFGKDLPTRVGMKPKHLFLFKCADGQIITKIVINLKSPSDEKHIIEILGHGQQFIAFGKHPIGSNYEWISKRNPLNTPIDELCELSFSNITDWISESESWLPDGWSIAKVTGLNQQQSNEDIKPIIANNVISHSIKPLNMSTSNHTNISIEQLKSYLDDIENTEDYHNWITIGMCLHNFDNVHGLKLWKNWSSKSDKYKKGECESKWATFNNTPANPLGIGTVIQQSKEARRVRISNKIDNCKDADELLTILKNAKNDESIQIDSYSHLLDRVKDKYQSLTNRKLNPKELNSFFKNEYQLQEDGVYYFQEKNGHQISTRICGFIEIDAITRNQYDENYGIRLKFKTILGNMKILCLARAIVFEKNGTLQRQLVNHGFDIHTLHTKEFEHYINSQTQCETILYTTDRTGWYNNSSFVLPHKTLGEDGCIFQSSSNLSLAFSQSGTLEDWKFNVARYCSGNPLLMLAVCSAFAGPLLSKVNMNGGGFHIFGNSSSGKSTISKVASSVYGEYSQYVKSWRATTNGLEGSASQFNDTLLILDEISQSNGDISQSIYMIANGQSKCRADKYGAARDVKNWNTFILSNGERTIACHSAEFNKTLKAGVSLRLLDVPVAAKFGIYDNLHDINSGKELSEYLTLECKKNYGYAGPLFIENVIKDDINFSQLFMDYQDYFITKYSKKYGGSLTSQEQRALKFFALAAMAGELSIEYGITDWKNLECSKLIFDCFVNWKNLNQTQDNADIEKNQVFASILDFIDKHGSGRFMNVHDVNRIINNQAGYIKKIDGEIHYLFNSSGFNEAIKGNNKHYAIKILKEADWLICDSGRNQNLHSIKNAKSRFYEIVIRDFIDS